jgi:hypothetical protein
MRGGDITMISLDEEDQMVRISTPLIDDMIRVNLLYHRLKWRELWNPEFWLHLGIQMIRFLSLLLVSYSVEIPCSPLTYSSR